LEFEGFSNFKFHVRNPFQNLTINSGQTHPLSNGALLQEHAIVAMIFIDADADRVPAIVAAERINRSVASARAFATFSGVDEMSIERYEDAAQRVIASATAAIAQVAFFIVVQASVELIKTSRPRRRAFPSTSSELC